MPRAADIREVTLEDGGNTLSLLNLGCTTRGWWVTGGQGRVPVVLGYADPARYLDNRYYLGAIVGRVANRMRGARFMLEGREVLLPPNEGANQLHGGAGGLHTRLWQVEMDGPRAARFTYRSPDGEAGYPGRAEFTVTVRLEAARVTYEMEARVDRPTPINLAQHNYYSLGMDGPLRSATFTCAADRFTPVDEALLPTGDILPVAGTRHDFRSGARFQDLDPRGEGTDLNVVLPERRDPVQPVARLLAPNGRHLKMWTDQPALQVYTAHHLSHDSGAHPGQQIAPFNAVCLEPQGFPDAVNQPDFPSVIVTPDQPYRQRTTVEIKEPLA